MSPLPLHITYFEHAPSFSHGNGTIGICLGVSIAVPDGAQKARTNAAIVTTLKCNIVAAISLRDAINAALLLAQPIDNPHGKPS